MTDLRATLRLLRDVGMLWIGAAMGGALSIVWPPTWWPVAATGLLGIACWIYSVRREYD